MSQQLRGISLAPLAQSWVRDWGAIYDSCRIAVLGFVLGFVQKSTYTSKEIKVENIREENKVREIVLLHLAEFTLLPVHQTLLHYQLVRDLRISSDDLMYLTIILDQDLKLGKQSYNWNNIHTVKDVIDRLVKPLPDE